MCATYYVRTLHVASIRSDVLASAKILRTIILHACTYNELTNGGLARMLLLACVHACSRLRYVVV